MPTNLKSAIESLLFVHGEPMSFSRLAKATGASSRDLEAALRELASEYRERGIILIENSGTWQFVTHSINKELLETFLTSGRSEELTKSGVEVLAIIAYKGPMSRAAVEYIRGVNSSFILRSLLIRGLIEREENPKDRRSYMYRVSNDFLKHLGISNLRDLPEFETFSKQEIEIPEGEIEAGNAPSL
jgi:segregation and condensation protein B